MAKEKSTAGRLPAAKAGVIALLILVLSGMAQSCGGNKGEAAKGEERKKPGMLLEMADATAAGLYDMFMPCILFERSGGTGCWLFLEQIDSLFPFYGYATEEYGTGEILSGPSLSAENKELREILLAEAEEGISSEEPADPEIQEEMEQSLGELLKEENEAAMQRQENLDFSPHVQQSQVDLESLKDYETLVKQFYIVDSTTIAGSDRLNVESFLAKDMSVSKEGTGPQILIFHTHSREAFADSVEGDRSTTIVGVGERLAQILTEDYGYNVLHHTAEYDTDRNQAYSKALPELEQILRDNPSIQVVIDLHRDEMPESTRLVMDLDGKPTARFMFFNGLSKTKKTGDITYLYNENLDGNLAFSFQMQKKAVEFYPGLTRKIYLKGYRYNMHLKDKYLLVELGAQNNTVEEAMNACDPLAHILDMVLSGE